MIIYDTEVFKYDWLICWLDTKTRKTYHIVNDSKKLLDFYKFYKNDIWVGYNSRNYDVFIVQGILCGFNPYDISTFIIEKERKGWEYSRLFTKFPIINYDTSVGFRSLKELEAFMGHDIRETSVPFDIDRKLTEQEIKETIGYCKHDVMEAFEVLIETSEEFESHIGLVNEFELGLHNLSKTKAQLSAKILGAVMKPHDDEFEISFPPTLEIGKYSNVVDWFNTWAAESKDYSDSYDTIINGVPHTIGFGGLHGAVKNYVGDGYFLMCDVASYYPAMMIEYNYLSRNVVSPIKFKQIRDERIVMKRAKDKRQLPRKIVLNSTFGASKDKYNPLYDPLQANNICIGGQVLLIDLLDKLDGKCELIQSNTDGILVKLRSKDDKAEIMKICNTWSERTGMELEFDEYVKVIQKDVNNYIIVEESGKMKRKGAFVKKLHKLDNDLPIVNKAVVDYLVYGTPVEKTIMECDQLIDFQKITKVSRKYDYAFKEDFYKPLVKFYKQDEVQNMYGEILHERVFRCFASKDSNDGTLYKKHKDKTTVDKTPATPEKCRIVNDNVVDLKVPTWLDKEWYIKEASDRVKAFLA